MRTLAVLAVVAASACTSTTVISSRPAGAHLYLDGVYKGDTPYTHSETTFVWTKHAVRLEKDGYKESRGMIYADNWNVAGVLASIFCFLPGLLFSTEYRPSYEFSLEPAQPAYPGATYPPPHSSELSGARPARLFAARVPGAAASAPAA
jgi:hypothetical protein